MMRAWMLAAAWVGAAAGAQSAADIARGEALYFGRDPAYVRAGAVDLAGTALPPQAAACVACHRRSGLGSAEGGRTVPPIAGHLLFKPLSPQTGQRLPWPSRDRVRPAYDLNSLAQALAKGVAPDGVRFAAPMPRYRFTADEVAALAAYLNTLSADTAPGVTDEEVVFATVTTPEVPAAQVQDLLQTLRAYLAARNAGTRHEERRRAQALATDSTMYRRFRRWRLEHWPLQGEPATWRAQLEARYAAQPVFALLSGLSYDDWTPVHEFCEHARLPCLLPMAWLPPPREDFYSIYFAPGLRAEVEAALAGLPAPAEAVVWTTADAVGARQRAAIAAELARHGIAIAQRAPRAEDVLIAALPPDQFDARWSALRTLPAQVRVLGGLLGQWPDRWLQDDPQLRARAAVATPYLTGAQAGRQLARARAWFAARAFRPNAEPVAVGALAAAMVANEMLVHVDERFSREYCIEKIEHNLENGPPLTAYARLSIGPAQRFAARRARLFERATPEGAIAEAATPSIR